MNVFSKKWEKVFASLQNAQSFAAYYLILYILKKCSNLNTASVVNHEIRNNCIRKIYLWHWAFHFKPLKQDFRRQKSFCIQKLKIIWKSDFLFEREFFDCTHLIRQPCWCQNKSKVSLKFCTIIESNCQRAFSPLSFTLTWLSWSQVQSKNWLISEFLPPLK